MSAEHLIRQEIHSEMNKILDKDISIDEMIIEFRKIANGLDAKYLNRRKIEKPRA